MKDSQDKTKWLVLVTVMVGTFLGRIDQTIVNLAIPNIIEGFNITVSAAGWIATAYIIANAIFVPIWGKLGDSVGRKKIYLWGFIIFIVGSVLAGLSWNLGSLLVFRIIQAIASSADYPTAMAIIVVTFTEAKERAQALGIWSASFAAGAVFGPLIGGPLIDAFGWRSIFLINLPVGIVGLAMAFIFVEESKSVKKTMKFDWLGAVYLGIMLSSLVLVLDKGIDWGWFSLSSLGAYAVIAVFFGLFMEVEIRHPEPLVDLKFFKNRLFVTTLINNFIVFMAMMGSVFLVPVFAQTFLGYNSTQAGLIFIPMALCFLISSPIGGSFIGKVQPRYIIFLSTLIAAVGIFLLTFIDPRSNLLDLIFPLSVMALGMGLGMAQRTAMIATAVPQEEVGVASSVLALTRNIAGAFGIAIFATILTTVTQNKVLAIARESVFHITDPHTYQQAVGLIILKAQVSAYGVVFLLASLLLVLGALSALFIRGSIRKNAPTVIAE